MHEAAEALVKAASEDLIEFNVATTQLLAKASDIPEPRAHTVFSTEDAANTHLAGIKPVGNIAYRLARTADGHWVVQVFKLVGTL